MAEAIEARLAAADAALPGDLFPLLDNACPSIRNAAWWGVHRLAGRDFGYFLATNAEQRTEAALEAEAWWERRKTAPRLKPPDKRTTRPLVIDLGEGLTLPVVIVPPGGFIMGSPKTERGLAKNEGDPREAVITRAFLMGACEVTQRQYEKVVGRNRNLSHVRDPNSPVTNVSWNCAMEFCRELSKQTGLTVALPTEAEWEYACRAGTKTPYHTGNVLKSSEARFFEGSTESDRYRRNPGPVGGYPPNAFGLYDMHGNVGEWCVDWYIKKPAHVPRLDPHGPAEGTSRVIRGGSCRSGAGDCRSASRGSYRPTTQSKTVGFRIVVRL